MRPGDEDSPVGAGMFERYSEMARRVIHMSRYMAGRVGSPEIETEHLLLGLLREDKALARRFLGTPWAAEAVWRKIAQSKRSEEHTSELQSHSDLVCRLLLE